MSDLTKYYFQHADGHIDVKQITEFRPTDFRTINISLSDGREIVLNHQDSFDLLNFIGWNENGINNQIDIKPGHGGVLITSPSSIMVLPKAANTIIVRND